MNETGMNANMAGESTSNTQKTSSKTIVTQNSPKAWLLAARPKTLTGAAVPVLIGAALAFADSEGRPSWIPMALCFLFAFIMQIDANFINDYFDFMKGTDDEQRLGPERACSQGWVTARAMLTAIAITTVLACLVGLPLVLFGGWTMVAVGFVCVLFCFLYTTHLSYMGLGDILVLVFFGIIPVTLTYFLSLPNKQNIIPLTPIVASLACGLVIDTLLVINNYRDIDNDRRAGKRTLIVKTGAENGLKLYLLLGITACLAGIVFAFNSRPLAFFLPVLTYLPLHIATYREMKRIEKGRELNKVLGMTARNMFVYGISVAAGIVLSY